MRPEARHDRRGGSPVAGWPGGWTRSQEAMLRALDGGPAHCPPDLFQGAPPQIALGLQCHAATIAAARTRAIEDSFPRTRALVGDDRFAAAVTRHLARPGVMRRRLDDLARGFDRCWEGAARDLAAAEWAWLRAHRAEDRPALRLSDLAGLSEDQVVAVMVRAHPATRLIALSRPDRFAWEGPGDAEGPAHGDGPVLMITRPDAEVSLTRIDQPAAAFRDRLRSSTTLGSLLDADAAMTLAFLDAGALMRCGRAGGRAA